MMENKINRTALKFKNFIWWERGQNGSVDVDGCRPLPSGVTRGHTVWILGVCRPGECHVNLPFPVSGLLLWIYA